MPNSVLAPLFLTREQIGLIHTDQINRYGGTHGVREENLLVSAISMPQQSFGGDYLHRDLFEMAAAYAFHISQNHPFLDGNKRTAFASSLIFLEWNSVAAIVDQDRYEALIRRVSVGEKSKFDIADFLREEAQPS